MKSELIERIELIPPEGILNKLKPLIIEKFNGGQRKFFKDFELPSNKARFLIEVIVDDECEVCPYAIEAVSELSSLYENINAKFYNASYVSPPFEFNATPSFRINKVVRFTGLPFNNTKKYFYDFLKEAYVKSHEKLNWLILRAESFAKEHGYYRNPNEREYLNLIYKMLKSIDEYGEPRCPCRKNTVCPCPFIEIDMSKLGHCLCGLFWKKEKFDEYIKEKYSKFQNIIEEISSIQNSLEELKKKVISGKAKPMLENIINKLSQLYSKIEA
jgi:ferredoxin-thioredoxin reductase catalytic subunit